jgi:hypothetical protein
MSEISDKDLEEMQQSRRFGGLIDMYKRLKRLSSGCVDCEQRRQEIAKRILRLKANLISWNQWPK